MTPTTQYVVIADPTNPVSPPSRKKRDPRRRRDEDGEA
jgi:hypothetical protein